MTKLFTADIVAPITGPLIDKGAVVVRDGRIVAFGASAELALEFPHLQAEHLPGLLTAGLVNAHTHLQYTSFDEVGAEPFQNYTEWSIAFVDEYNKRENDDWAAIAHTGAEHMVTRGITAIGDIVTNFECRDVLLDLQIPGVAYLELIGVDLSDWTSGVGAQLREAVEGAPTTDVNSAGISPHAPYSIDAPVLTLMADLARELGVRLHIHVGESDGEDELYRTGTGSLADRLRFVTTRRVEVLANGGSGLGTGAYVKSLGLLGPNCHIAHGVYLGSEGRSIMTQEQTIVALCPRSNHIVGVDYPPVADYLRENTPFAVGTDSLGSAPSLDLLDDVGQLRRLAIAGGYKEPDLDNRLLQAATLGGATALGLDTQLGSIEVGKRADLAAFAVGSLEELTSSGSGSCTTTIIGGELRHRVQ